MSPVCGNFDDSNQGYNLYLMVTVMVLRIYVYEQRYRVYNHGHIPLTTPAAHPAVPLVNIAGFEHGGPLTGQCWIQLNDEADRTH